MTMPLLGGERPRSGQSKKIKSALSIWRLLARLEGEPNDGPAWA
jgi:hypothetical protein